MSTEFGRIKRDVVLDVWLRQIGSGKACAGPIPVGRDTFWPVADGDTVGEDLVEISCTVCKHAREFHGQWLRVANVTGVEEDHVDGRTVGRGHEIEPPVVKRCAVGRGLHLEAIEIPVHGGDLDFNAAVVEFWWEEHCLGCCSSQSPNGNAGQRLEDRHCVRKLKWIIIVNQRMDTFLLLNNGSNKMAKTCAIFQFIFLMVMGGYLLEIGVLRDWRLQESHNDTIAY